MSVQVITRSSPSGSIPLLSLINMTKQIKKVPPPFTMVDYPKDIKVIKVVPRQALPPVMPGDLDRLAYDNSSFNIKHHFSSSDSYTDTNTRSFSPIERPFHGVERRKIKI